MTATTSALSRVPDTALLHHGVHALATSAADERPDRRRTR